MGTPHPSLEEEKRLAARKDPANPAADDERGNHDECRNPRRWSRRLGPRNRIATQQPLRHHRRNAVRLVHTQHSRRTTRGHCRHRCDVRIVGIQFFPPRDRPQKPKVRGQFARILSRSKRTQYPIPITHRHELPQYVELLGLVHRGKPHRCGRRFTLRSSPIRLLLRGFRDGFLLE